MSEPQSVQCRGGSSGPPCPRCGHDVSRVLQARSSGVEEFKRRRECKACGQRFTSYESTRKIA